MPVDDVKCAIALLETLLDEGHEHFVLFVLAVEEGTNMPLAIQDRARQIDLFIVTHRRSPF
jgi:hypothetical protein